MFDQDFHNMQVKRYRKNFASDIIFKEVSERIEEVVADMQDAFKKNFSNILAHNFYSEMSIVTDDSKPYDLIISNLELHYDNNIQDTLTKYRSMLADGGAIVCTLFGGKTLIELRQILEQAELKLRNGVSPRVIPMIDVKDAGRLLQVSGYSYAIADLDSMEVHYKNFSDMLRHAKKIGQSNAITARNKAYPGAALFDEASNIAGDENLQSTFEIVTLSGIK